MRSRGGIYSEGSFVYLREVTESEAEDVYRWKQDPLIREMALGYAHKTTIEAETADINNTIKSDMQLYLIIFLKETDKPIGYIRINWMGIDKKFAWLRFSMGEQRRKGYMRDALRSFLTKAFELGMHRADAEAFPSNNASMKLMEGLGFKQEGLKREAYFDGETYGDMVALGLIKSDFIGK